MNFLKKQIGFLKELLPLMATLLLQRAIYISNNRLLSFGNNQEIQSYNYLFPIISIGVLFELANISAINNFYSKEISFKLPVIKTVFLNFIIIGIILILGFTFKTSIFQFLKIDFIHQNISMHQYILTLGILASVIIFSVFEGFLIIRRLSVTLAKILFSMVIINFCLYFILNKFFQLNDLSAILTSTLSSYIVGMFGSILILKTNDISNKSVILEKRQSFFWIWISELKISIIRSIAPIALTYFLLRSNTQSDLLTPYNMAVQLSYVGALLYLSAAPVALREESKWKKSNIENNNHISPFLQNSFLIICILPTILIFLTFSIIPEKILLVFFGYVASSDSIILLRLFFIASFIGQVGHFFSIPVKAAGKVYLITVAFLISELIIQPSLLSYFYFTHNLTPETIGIAIVCFTACYFLINFMLFSHLKRKSKLC